MKYCTQCGAALADSAAFCTQCGARQAAAPAPEASTPQPSASVQAPVAAPAAPKPPKKKSPLLFIIPIAVLVIAIAGFFIYRTVSLNNEIAGLMEEAQEYIEKEKYKQAISRYEAVLELKENHAEAQAGLAAAQTALQIRDTIEEADAALARGNTDEAIKLYNEALSLGGDDPAILAGLTSANLSLAQNDLDRGDMEGAKAVLDQMDVKSSDDAYDWYTSLNSVVNLNAQVESVDAFYFPALTLTVTFDPDVDPNLINIGDITDGGAYCRITDWGAASEPGRLTVGCQTEAGEEWNTERSLDITLYVNGYPVTLNAPYQVPTPVVALVETEDVVQKLLGFPRNTTLLTVNGTPVTAESYLYCLSYTNESICGALYESMDEVDWDSMVEDVPLQTYITDSAVETATFYALIRAKAAENGVEVSTEDQAKLDMDIADVIANLGGEDEYALQLQMRGISDQGFRALNEVNVLYDGLEQKLFGSQIPSDEELAKFAEETADAMMAKHILIKTVDDANQPLPDEEAAAAKAKAEDLLAQLRTSDDPLTLFDKLMNEYSEDGCYEDGTLAGADGYLFGPGDMVPEFESGTRALDYNEISDLVKSEFGYHIILRLPPVNDEVREAWVSAKMNDQVTEWVDVAWVETTEEFSQVTPKRYYKALAVYREALAGAAEGGLTPASDSKTTPPTLTAMEGRSEYTFISGDVRLPMNEEFSTLRDALGEPLSYYEAESYAFQGLDKTFNYPGFELVTYPNGDKDYISDIYFTDTTVATPEGIHIGSTLEEVKAAYGEGYTADDFGIYYTYIDGDTRLRFGTEDGVVTEIEYMAVNDLLN